MVQNLTAVEEGADKNVPKKTQLVQQRLVVIPAPVFPVCPVLFRFLQHVLANNEWA